MGAYVAEDVERLIGDTADPRGAVFRMLREKPHLFRSSRDMSSSQRAAFLKECETAPAPAPAAQPEATSAKAKSARDQTPAERAAWLADYQRKHNGQ
jgi:hypothetical protein